MHSDRLAGEIGIFVIKVILVINGAGSIALIGSFSHLAKRADIGALLSDGGQFFLWGLTAGVIGAIFAYFYQSVNTASEWSDMKKTYEQRDEMRWTITARLWLLGAAILSQTIGFVCFIIGSHKVLGAFRLTNEVNGGWMM